ncbi:extracellular solute-binding protein [Thermus sp. SYSU G05001]|uniref:Extracellular solute-binding protein n=1 Tax=Thermus brevis TaxID=2862456 RepID=A0ABS7A1F8_9DEIN|nr:extracellular solute-binding protein [Thermus brevis]MBW6396134.1 extracellular solute-binding protein [Thermus brevis]
MRKGHVKRFGWLLWVLGMLALVSGGFGALAQSQTKAITVSSIPGAMFNTLSTLGKQFEQKTGIKVNVIEEPAGGAFDALIAAGNQPDVVVASFGPQVGKLAAQGALVPVGDLPGAKELLAAVLPKSVVQVYGKNYYIPWGLDVTVMAYNKELFKRAGLDPNKPPRTWAEFLDYAKKIQALSTPNNKIYGTTFWNEALVWGGWYWNMLMPIYLNANQGRCTTLANRLGTGVIFDRPECKMADFFAFLREAQQYAPLTMDPNFFSRKVGMWLQYGYSWEPNLKSAADRPMKIGEDVGIAPIPVPKAGDKSFSTFGGRALLLLKTTPERQQMGWEFIRFLMEKDNNLYFLKSLGYLPTLKSLQNDPYFQTENRKPFVEILQNAVVPDMTNAAEEVNNAVLSVYPLVVIQKKLTPEEGVKEAVKRAMAALRGQ